MTTNVTIIKVTPYSAGAALGQAQVLYSDTQKVLALLKANKIDAYTITAPDGRPIPVLKARLMKEIEGPPGVNAYQEFDEGNRVWVDEMDGRFPYYPIFDSSTPRAIDDFDYAKFGLRKVEDIWLHPNNRRALETLKNRQPETSWRCVIL